MIEDRSATSQHALPHEAKFTALDMKSVADDGIFEGYASIFGRQDLGRDIVMPGAFRDTLATRGASGVRMLFQHNPAEPIGTWDTLAEDSKGLFARGRIMPTVNRAREVLALMRAGAIDGLSIGFRTVKAHRDRARGVRRIEKVDLWEISIVTFPLLPEARIATIKAQPFAGQRPSEREFERWLTQDAGLTRTEARAVLRSGFKGLAALRDAAAGLSETARLTNRCAAVAAYLRSTPTT